MTYKKCLILSDQTRTHDDANHQENPGKCWRLGFLGVGKFPPRSEAAVADVPAGHDCWLAALAVKRTMEQ